MNRPPLRATFAASLVVALSPFAQATAAPFSILYHETLRSAQGVVGLAKVQGVESPSTSLTFQAFGKRFDVVLEPNERIAAAAKGESAGVELYRGKLAGREGTWARLNRRAGQWSGAIFDGSELYFIDRSDALQPLLAQPRADDGGTIVYRWSDTAGELADEVVDGGTASGTGGEQRSAAALLDGFAVETLLNPLRELSVGFIADYEFTQNPAGQANARMLEMANIIDGIFIQQVGIAIVPQFSQFTTADDPFTSAVPLTLLEELETHKFGTPALRTAGIAHLFTGRTLESTGTSGSSVVGIAIRSAVCEERFGVSLAQTTFGVSTNALIAAHEIAHNLGAPHDTETGSVCAATAPGFLMEPRVNGRTELSQCSLDEITRVVATKACLSPIAPVDLALGFGFLSPPPTATLSEFRAEVVVTSPPSGSAARNVVVSFDVAGSSIYSITRANGWACNAGIDKGTCSIGVLPAGRTDVLTLNLVSRDAATGLHAEVVSGRDPNAANDAIDHAFLLGPGADVRLSLTPERIEGHPGEERPFTATVTNRRFGDAVGTKVKITFGQTAMLVSATPSQGSCGPTSSAFIYECDLQTIPLGASRQITGRVRMNATIQSPTGDRWQIGKLDAIATVTGATDVFPDDNDATVDAIVADGFVDIVGSIAGPASLPLKQTGRYVYTFRNDGPDTATNLDISLYGLSSPVNPTIVSVTGPGTCTNGTPPLVPCAVPALAPGQSLIVTLDVVSVDSVGGLSVHASHTQPQFDRNIDNSWPSLFVSVQEAAPPPATPTPAPPVPAPAPAPPSGGGGGGATGIELIALLVAACLRRRWRPSGARFASK